ncbi:hypothetical protein QBC36DRAFT_311677 [Triangularia setosa]|uniref:Uncharacterized protein n=1 Tax=Triangularia setosa TaxID=2587417 RepID=A0AAN6W6D3_9PEZI|nr:hypothetical protein QBC36DRAFT_311677 [Podospora setosa]
MKLARNQDAPFVKVKAIRLCLYIQMYLFAVRYDLDKLITFSGSQFFYWAVSPRYHGELFLSDIIKLVHRYFHEEKMARILSGATLEQELSYGRATGYPGHPARFVFGILSYSVLIWESPIWGCFGVLIIFTPDVPTTIPDTKPSIRPDHRQQPVAAKCYFQFGPNNGKGFLVLVPQDARCHIPLGEVGEGSPRNLEALGAFMTRTKGMYDRHTLYSSTLAFYPRLSHTKEVHCPDQPSQSSNACPMPGSAIPQSGLSSQGYGWHTTVIPGIQPSNITLNSTYSQSPYSQAGPPALAQQGSTLLEPQPSQI